MPGRSVMTNKLIEWQIVIEFNVMILTRTIELLQQLCSESITGIRNKNDWLSTRELNNNEISWTIEDTNGTFTELTQVTKLGLAANRIKSIARKAFAGMGSLKILDLHDNAIATIQENAFSELPSLEELRLNSSSLLCDCQLKWLPLWLQTSGLASSDHVAFQCGHPESLVGQLVLDVSPDNFTCGTSQSSHFIIWLLFS